MKQWVKGVVIVAVLALGLPVAAAWALTGTGHRGHFRLSLSSPQCAVAAAPLQNRDGGTWLVITGTGFTVGQLYLIAVTDPSGAEQGDSLFPAPDGTIGDSNIEADPNFPPTLTGLYTVNISPNNGGGSVGSVVATCTVEV